MKDLFSFKKIYQAYLDCRENKRKTINALKFEWDLERKLFELQEELKERSYKPGRSICFVVTDPSPREIFAADFRDRIVHHLLVNELEAAGEKVFIHDSYSCREDKGTHAAIERLKGFMSKATANYTHPAYFLQLDISGFFMSIDHNVLYAIFKKLVLRQDKSYDWKKQILWLARQIIFHEPTEDYIKKGDRSLFELIPSRKSLFCFGDDKGLPIGNYSSQFFANLYLNQLDQFVKRRLKRKYYLRYVDDFLILGKDKKILRSLVGRINTFLKEKLKLNLNSKKTKLKNLSRGVDFLGYFVKPRYALARRRVVNTCKDKLRRFNRHPDSVDVGEIQAVANSYFGHFKHADTYKLRKDLYKNNLGRLRKNFKVDSDYFSLSIK